MSYKLKLSSNREVELNDLTYAQREECEDSVSLVRLPDGGLEIRHTARTRTLWCYYGLGLDDKEKLNEYSNDELDDIMVEVSERAAKAQNPTTAAS